jgi:hypothetical protein
MYGTPPVLDARERATSRNCLTRMKSALTDIMNYVLGEEEDDLVIGGPEDGHAAEKSPLANEDELVLAFLDDPEEVLRESCYAMTTSPELDDAFTQNARLPGDQPDGPDYYLIEQERNVTVRFYAQHPSYPGARNLQVEETREVSAKRVLLLPWADSKLTYCKLAADADLVLTGPLNGCSVFVVQATAAEGGKDTYLFHVNANRDGGDDYVRVQRSKLDAALNRLWPEVGERTITHRLDFDQYGTRRKDMAVEGIVYGTRRGSGEWEFSYYVIDVDGAGRCTRRGDTPDPLPREATV